MLTITGLDCLFVCISRNIRWSFMVTLFLIFLHQISTSALFICFVGFGFGSFAFTFFTFTLFIRLGMLFQRGKGVFVTCGLLADGPTDQRTDGPYFKPLAPRSVLLRRHSIHLDCLIHSVRRVPVEVISLVDMLPFLLLFFVQRFFDKTSWMPRRRCR